MTSTPAPRTGNAGGGPVVIAAGSTIVAVITWTAIPTVAPGSTAATKIASGHVRVDAGDQYFIPSDLKVTVGTTVEWSNVGADEHDVVARDGSLNSRTLEPGGQFSVTFDTPGLHDYICTFHYDNGMFGAIQVIGPETPAPPPSD